MGLHTGEAELRDGDYYGTAVNRAARLMSVAHGGQIVVSAVTSELVRDGSVELRRPGRARLRDLGEPERVFQVAHPELDASSRRCGRSTSSPGTCRCSRPRSSAGAASIAQVAGLRVRHRGGDAHRAGGVGKTRLALQVAAVLPARVRRRRVVRGARAGERRRTRRRGGVGDVGLHVSGRRRRRDRPVHAACGAGSCCWCSTTASIWSRASRRSSMRSRPAHPTCGCSRRAARVSASPRNGSCR